MRDEFHCPRCGQLKTTNCYCDPPRVGRDPVLSELKPFCKENKKHSFFKARVVVEQIWEIDRDGDMVGMVDDEAAIVEDPGDNLDSYECAICGADVDWLDPESDNVAAMAIATHDDQA